jgi:hypothetical protein
VAGFCVGAGVATLVSGMEMRRRALLGRMAEQETGRIWVVEVERSIALVVADHNCVIDR